MPSKIKPRPLRLDDERLARVNDHAKTLGKSQHAALLDLIDRGLVASEGRPEAGIPTAAPVIGGTLVAEAAKRRGKSRVAAAVLATATPVEPGRGPLDTSMVPELGTFERKPLQKASAQPKRKWKL